MKHREIYEILRQGSDLRDSGRPLEAIEAYDLILKTHPDHPSALSFKAGALMCLERYEEALNLVDAAIVSAPNDAGLYWQRARYLYRLGFFRKAIPEFIKMKGLDKGYYGEMPLLFMADCWFYLGEYQKAREVCAEIPDAYSFPGFRLKADGSKQDVLADIERVENWQKKRKKMRDV